ncbi:SseB family protein [Paracoccus sp. Z330]|uniref:SseB family protein n=1 Tax=Paracoccus onchidii TaxID=3017813 RepID=A0ABT4ZAY0_9RHOB|nr:SseB family protein [Paracoccus onchidii]MDB6176504.1 SseB family protein [Paracoccus onchidii]
MSALDDLALTPFHDAGEAQRARMLSRLADTQLSVALVAEPADDQVELRIFPLDHGPVALACDSEDRLADFFGEAVAYVAMPGRVLAGLLRDEGAGLLVNPGHPSEMMLDTAMLDWLAGALAASPEAGEARLHLMAPLPDVVSDLAQPLAERLEDMRGLISGAALAGVGNEAAPAGHVIVVAGAEPQHQDAIAKALAEALAFLPPQDGGVDITFRDGPLPKVALRFELSIPEPVAPKRRDGPPILR